ncbi:nitrogenase component 1 [Cereibacter sphaeroides]|uniref:nitrogenase component 1 n=1 Tax=Cereibacter sphaeroides TaxID=1063 RepID=UPI001E3B7B99|nr:nitrogenase component 1 [Cereibacter sphaeroides]
MPVFLDTTSADFEAQFSALLGAKREDSPDVDDAVAAIIADVKARGDAAVIELTAKFDRLELTPENLSVRKATETDKARVIRIMGDETHMYENMAPKDMYATLKAAKADILMSGARSQFVALKARTPWIDVNQEKHEPYAGYMGMVDLVRAIDRSVNNPVWEDVRRPAPWDGPGDAPRPATGLRTAAPEDPAPGPVNDPKDFEDC